MKNKKQVSCNHKKKHAYSYNLVGAELNLCNICEKKLRKQILEQNKIEADVFILS